MNIRLYTSIKNSLIHVTIIVALFCIWHLIGFYGFGLEDCWTQHSTYTIIMFISIFFIGDLIGRYRYLKGGWRSKLTMDDFLKK